MMGISLSKLIVLVLIIAAVWYGFKYVTRRNQMLDEEKNRGNLRDNGNDASRNTVHDMETCTVCGTFVPAGAAKACGRAGCPYPG